MDGLSPSILLQDNSGISSTVDNFEIINNFGKFLINYGDNNDANDDGNLSNNAFAISGTGDVGIGTFIPQSKLHIDDPSASDVTITTDWGLKMQHYKSDLWTVDFQ